MPRTFSTPRRTTAGALVALAAFATVGLLLATSAISKPGPVRLHSERVASLGHSVLAAPSRMTLYRLRPETTHHLLCTSRACLAIWTPLTVPARSHVRLPKGIHGKVTLLKRGHKHQVAVSGHPLYTFAEDSAPKQARGQRIHSFGGTWFTLRVRGSRHSGTPSPPPPPPSLPPGY